MVSCQDWRQSRDMALRRRQREQPAQVEPLSRDRTHVARSVHRTLAAPIYLRAGYNLAVVSKDD